MKRYVLIKNISRLVTMTDAGEGELGVITDAACLLKSGRVDWVGKAANAPKLEDYQVQTVDAEGGVVIPGLIDCHTHLVHGGSREQEVAERAKGKSYENIAKEGGGILSTVRATREASFEDLCSSALSRAEEAFKKGVTTMEVKSGYGLDTGTEIKMLKVVEWLEQNHPISFVPTFLGAHAVPVEFKDNRDKYVDLIINDMIPKVAKEGLALFCDVFVEEIAFSADEARAIFKAAKYHGLKPKLHIDQFIRPRRSDRPTRSDMVGVVSADHLEYVTDDGIADMREAGVVPVVIPGSTFYLGQSDYAPARKMIDAGLPVAISTDYNPGTSPSLDLFLMATIAISRMKMTMEECLRGITINAAKALQIEDGRGAIRPNGVADLIIIDALNEYFPIYRYGSNCVKCVIKGGKVRCVKGE